jgi:hypothetical protein
MARNPDSISSIVAFSMIANQMLALISTRQAMHEGHNFVKKRIHVTEKLWSMAKNAK